MTRADRAAAKEAARLAELEAERVKAEEEVAQARAAAAEIAQARNQLAALEHAEQNKGLCGHVNMHHKGTTVLKCVLPRAHAGNHEGPYTNIRGEQETGAWKDEAGYAISK
jgi:hypothetical protein